MEKYKFTENDMYYFEDFINEVEEKYNVKFLEEELLNLHSMSQLCELILEKIDLEEDDLCTSAYVFYKIKKSMRTLECYNADNLTPDTRLSEILKAKEKDRKALIKLMESELGFKLEPFYAKSYIFWGLILLMSGSMFLILHVEKLGLAVLVLSFILLYNLPIVFPFREKSIREWIHYIVRENYLKIRSDRNAVNKKELRKVLFSWFSFYWGIDREKIENVYF